MEIVFDSTSEIELMNHIWCFTTTKNSFTGAMDGSDMIKLKFYIGLIEL